MSRRIARIKVPISIFYKELPFPFDTKIIDIEYNSFKEELTIYVSNPDLPKVEDNEVPPLITPLIHHITWDWNLSEELKSKK